MNLKWRRKEGERGRELNQTQNAEGYSQRGKVVAGLEWVLQGALLRGLHRVNHLFIGVVIIWPLAKRTHLPQRDTKGPARVKHS